MGAPTNLLNVDPFTRDMQNDCNISAKSERVIMVLKDVPSTPDSYSIVVSWHGRILGTKFLIGAGQGKPYMSDLHLDLTRAHRKLMRGADLKVAECDLKFHVRSIRTQRKAYLPKFQVKLLRWNI